MRRLAMIGWIGVVQPLRRARRRSGASTSTANRFRLKGTLYVKGPNGELKAQDYWDIWLRRDS